MHALNKPCENCHKPMNGGVYRASHICPHCAHDHGGGKVKAHRSSQVQSVSDLETASNSENYSNLDVASQSDFDPVAETTATVEENSLEENWPTDSYQVDEVEDAQDDASYQAPIEASADKAFDEVAAFVAEEPELAEEADRAPEQDNSAHTHAIDTRVEPVDEKVLAQQQEFDRLDYPEVSVGTASLQHEAAVEEDHDHEEIELGLPASTAPDEFEPRKKVEPAIRDTASVKTPKKADVVVLTSKSVEEQHPHSIVKKLKFECALNIKLTPDLFKNGKFIGNKSDKFLAALKQGQKHVLSKLRQEAEKLGANVVSNVSVKNSIRGVDKKTASILVTATGTSIKKVESAFDTADI